MKVFLIILAIIVLGFLGIRYFLFRIGDPVNSKVSDSYFYHYRKNLIVHSPMGNWFELGYFESDADVESFQPINRDFGKDKEHIFWKGRKQDVDYVTFDVDDSGIIKDKNHVYTTNGKEYNFLGIIEGADPESYQLLDQSLPDHKRISWFKDSNAVFYRSKKTEGDPATFKPLNDGIAVDANFIYSIINDRGEGMYAHDVDEVIRKHKRMEGEIKVINDTYVQIGNAVVSAFTKDEFTIHTFETIKNTKEIDYFTVVVNDTLIYKGTEYPEIDIESFESLDYGYCKDKANLYYNGKKIIGVSFSGFEIIAPDYSKDDQHVYYKDAVVKNANPKTFKRTSENDVWEDGTNKFRNGKIIN
ncbi:DKNYY domain-containing protein [Flavobacterium fluviatile]|uniref:DKNYY domain-containing protein n=1 Tax=Flavobacterium fluviatile TaxID=1862387 RepID=UPI0013D7972F|nr:DKNYY domain-containing protein [Flavobacterium fluviatile]